jgi:hypothetical protein
MDHSVFTSFFGQSAVSSSIQSVTLPSRRSLSMSRERAHAQQVELADKIAEDD